MRNHAPEKGYPNYIFTEFDNRRITTTGKKAQHRATINLTAYRKAMD